MLILKHPLPSEFRYTSLYRRELPPGLIADVTRHRWLSLKKMTIADDIRWYSDCSSESHLEFDRPVLYGYRETRIARRALAHSVYAGYDFACAAHVVARGSGADAAHAGSGAHAA